MAINLTGELKKQYLEYQDGIKLKNQIAARIAKDYPLRAKAMLSCANTRIIAHNKVTGQSKVVYGEYCNDRLCPLCQQALHRERASKLSYMVQQRVKMGEVPYFFTISPAPNCSLENLKETSRAVINIFNRVRKQFFNADVGVTGFWRTLEFTKHDHKKRNLKDEVADDADYHPHIHCVFMFKPPYQTPNVYDISKFIKEEVAKQLKSKDARYSFYKHLEGTAGIVNIKRVNTSNPGFSFELSKYIALSKNLSDVNLKLFAEQIKDLQCHRSTGSLGWSKEYKTAYSDFIQNENSTLFNDDDTVYVEFTHRKGGFSFKFVSKLWVEERIKSKSNYKYITRSSGAPPNKYIQRQKSVISKAKSKNSNQQMRFA